MTAREIAVLAAGEIANAISALNRTEESGVLMVKWPLHLYVSRGLDGVEEFDFADLYNEWETLRENKENEATND